ncbi:MAG TPA: RnfH family protein [Gammaproteobacteria bacterium]
MATADGPISIEVAYARPQEQLLVPLRVPAGTTAMQAIVRSGIQERFPELDLSKARIGVFGRLCPHDRVLEAGDRVEIYRPLAADPKEARRRLAARGKSIGRAGDDGQGGGRE